MIYLGRESGKKNKRKSNGVHVTRGQSGPVWETGSARGPEGWGDSRGQQTSEKMLGGRERRPVEGDSWHEGPFEKFYENSLL